VRAPLPPGERAGRLLLTREDGKRPRAPGEIVLAGRLPRP